MSRKVIFDPLANLCVAVAYVLADYKYIRGSLPPGCDEAYLDEYVAKMEAANKDLIAAVTHLDRENRKKLQNQAA